MQRKNRRELMQTLALSRRSGERKTQSRCHLTPWQPRKGAQKRLRVERNRRAKEGAEKAGDRELGGCNLEARRKGFIAGHN